MKLAELNRQGQVGVAGSESDRPPAQSHQWCSAFPKLWSEAEGP